MKLDDNRTRDSMISTTANIESSLTAQPRIDALDREINDFFTLVNALIIFYFVFCATHRLAENYADPQPIENKLLRPPVPPTTLLRFYKLN